VSKDPGGVVFVEMIDRKRVEGKRRDVVEHRESVKDWVK